MFSNRNKSVTISSTESGSEDSNSLKEHMLLGSKGLHHVSSAVSMTKVDSTNSLSSVLNMYDLHAGKLTSQQHYRHLIMEGDIRAYFFELCLPC